MNDLYKSMGRTNMNEYYFKHILEKRSKNVQEYIDNLKTPENTMLPPGMNKINMQFPVQASQPHFHPQKLTTISNTNNPNFIQNQKGTNSNNNNNVNLNLSKNLIQQGSGSGFIDTKGTNNVNNMMQYMNQTNPNSQPKKVQNYKNPKNYPFQFPQSNNIAWQNQFLMQMNLMNQLKNSNAMNSLQQQNNITTGNLNHNNLNNMNMDKSNKLFIFRHCKF